MTSSPQ